MLLFQQGQCGRCIGRRLDGVPVLGEELAQVAAKIRLVLDDQQARPICGWASLGVWFGSAFGQLGRFGRPVVPRQPYHELTACAGLTVHLDGSTMRGGHLGDK